MRFLADMGIAMRTVQWLRHAGHDAVHLREQGLKRLPDGQIIDKARTEERIVLTMDLEFGYLLAVSGGNLPSVILFRLSNEHPDAVNARLADVLAQCAAELLQGAIISVRDTDHRVRPLPIWPA